MKQHFSQSWKSSRQPRKQRKYRANAPLHVRHKMMSVNLSKELRKKYGKRNFPIRKGDSVRVLRGGFKGKTGKIELVEMQKMKVRIDGIYRTKKDGTKVSVWFEPSNLQIKELDLDDKIRRKALERKATPEKKKEIKAKPLPKSNKEDNKKLNKKEKEK